jgi:hypothetical protein
LSVPDAAVDLTDVQFIKEELPSADQIADAKKLLLPKTFYNYLKAQPCPGCIGCDSDNFDFSQIKPRSPGGEFICTLSFKISILISIQLQQMLKQQKTSQKLLPHQLVCTDACSD